MINAVVEQYPDALSALFTRARVLGQLQRFDEAAADLMKVREKVPDDVQTLRLLAGYLEQAGRIEEAAKLLNDNALRLAEGSEPDSVDSLKEQLVGLQAREGKWLEVANLSGEMLLSRPPGPGRTALFELHIESLVRSDQSNKALDVIKREEQRFGAAPALALTRAEVYREIDKQAKAIKALEAPILAGPLERNEVLRLASLLYEMDETSSAEQALERHAGQGGLDPLFAVGQFYSLRGDFERAVGYLERANELVDDDTGSGVKAELYFWTGQAYERTKRFEQAAAAFERVLEIQPRHATTLNYLGYMWADLGQNLDRALELIETAIEQQPENGAFLDSLGWVYYRLGRFEEAEKTLLDAVTRVPDDSTILEHLGDVRLALGLEQEARQAYEQALAINDEENAQAVREKLDKLNAEL
jgi:tetratricopeptide (TPR) repeat protein